MAKNKKKEEKPEEKINPVVIMGNDMAFPLSDILDMDNKPEVKEAMDEWIEKKRKAFERAEKRRMSQRPFSNKKRK